VSADSFDYSWQMYEAQFNSVTVPYSILVAPMLALDFPDVYAYATLGEFNGLL